jgi:hypothetical protein
MLLQGEDIVFRQASMVVVFVEIPVKPLDAMKGVLNRNSHVEAAAVVELNDTFLSLELAEFTFLHPKVLICGQR